MPEVMLALPSVCPLLVSSEPPKKSPCDDAPIPVTSSISAFRAETVVLLDADSVSVEPCVDCRPTGSVTCTTNGEAGAGPESVATTVSPLRTPDAPKLAESLESGEPSCVAPSEVDGTPRAAPIAAFSSPTVVELLAARVSVLPYAACSGVGTETITFG